MASSRQLSRSKADGRARRAPSRMHAWWRSSSERVVAAFLSVVFVVVTACMWLLLQVVVPSDHGTWLAAQSGDARLRCISGGPCPHPGHMRYKGVVSLYMRRVWSGEALRAAADTRRAGRVECAPLAARATTKEWGGLANAIRYRTIVDWIERVQHSGSEMTEYS